MTPVGVLFSGGKDSSLALWYAMRYVKVLCLISIISENPYSYMFHTPNIRFVKEQSIALGIPLVIGKTKGQKEVEIKDLESTINLAIKKYKIKGLVSGAIASVYQASRIQKICKNLGIISFNPLWQRSPITILNQIIELQFETIVTGTFAEGLSQFIGQKIDKKFLDELIKFEKKYKIHLAGEGGEFETFVTDAPFFSKKLVITKKHVSFDDAGGATLIIDKLRVDNK
jgi:ABC transporter with metal-binding/Fe-S-binding domain ATP-binding protein